ncbi:hypothetical protein K0M31_006392 [Melipona bicolor]|uniref:Uncharacterized protein n=1 Tax=Melipona bicolor TaxID=60889 RepID=A0AA40FTG6_9HYME|nr:hypothetical protein K0M31_006392 [Melipona bicolor]
MSSGLQPACGPLTSTPVEIYREKVRGLRKLKLFCTMPRRKRPWSPCLKYRWLVKWNRTSSGSISLPRDRAPLADFERTFRLFNPGTNLHFHWHGDFSISTANNPGRSHFIKAAAATRNKTPGPNGYPRVLAPLQRRTATAARIVRSELIKIDTSLAEAIEIAKVLPRYFLLRLPLVRLSSSNAGAENSRYNNAADAPENKDVFFKRTTLFRKKLSLGNRAGTTAVKENPITKPRLMIIRKRFRYVRPLRNSYSRHIILRRIIKNVAVLFRSERTLRT